MSCWPVDRPVHGSIEDVKLPAHVAGSFRVSA